MDKAEARRLLRKHATDHKSYKVVLAHSLAVARYAEWLARRIRKNKKVDVEFVRCASILHDIGRFKYPPWKESIFHGVEGGRILRKEGVPEAYARVCDVHLGAGITAEEVKKQKLPLPPGDYMPHTVEEKIVTYADIRIAGEKIVGMDKVIRRFDEELGAKYVRRIVALHKYIQKLYKSKKTNTKTA